MVFIPTTLLYTVGGEKVTAEELKRADPPAPDVDLILSANDITPSKSGIKDENEV